MMDKDLSYVLNTLVIEHDRNCIILVGPPGSGKSTISDEIAREFSNFVIISPDRIREELFGDRHDQSHNDEVFSRVYQDLDKYSKEDYNIIYDATNCRPAYRSRIVNVLKPHAKKIICLMSTTPLVECINRNSERDFQVPDEVIEKMYVNLRNHPPTLFEGYDMIMRF